jgi:hypothetical protein
MSYFSELASLAPKSAGLTTPRRTDVAQKGSCGVERASVPERSPWIGLEKQMIRGLCDLREAISVPRSKLGIIPRFSHRNRRLCQLRQ